MTVACRYLLGAAMAALATTSLMADSYYKGDPQFHQWPNAKASRFQISRIGPIGLSLELIQPAFTMRISVVEPGIRSAAARSINNQQRYHLIMPLLKSQDPRGRHSGVTCLTGMFKGKGIPNDKITDEMFAIIAKMINDPEESWWVIEGALNAFGRARPELIAPHLKKLSLWLKNDDWWLRKASMVALTPVSTDKRFYKQILPIIGKMISSNERAVALHPSEELLNNSNQPIQKYNNSPSR